MKAAVIFHSVCGNTYLMAKTYYEKLKKEGVEVVLRKVEDDDLGDLANVFPSINEYKDDITAIKIAMPEDLLNNDHIFLGSPTYFGNVSAEMKTYMDKAADFWIGANLAGKKLSAFTSVGNYEGGGHMCLQAINTFGQHMGMMPVPVPSNLIENENFPAYGLIQYSGDLADNRPNINVTNSIEKYVEYCLKL